MNCRLCFVVLSVVLAATTGKGDPGSWAKYAATKSMLTTPVKAPVAKPQPKVPSIVVPQANTVPKESARSEPVAEAEDEPAAKAPKKPMIPVDNMPLPRKVPLFAKLILGDPDRPKLARVEELRSANVRSFTNELELPNKNTIPMTKLLLERSTELLRLFEEIQRESNGFVEDIEMRLANAGNDYIGYYN